MSAGPEAEGARRTAQAWVMLFADDPEAVSALAVVRRALEAGRALAGLRRLRLFELRGELPPRGRLEELLHRSTQFYNPHKERCLVRVDRAEPAPFASGEQALLVFERGEARRPAAERWWLHETGERIEVREGVAWGLRFTEGAEAARATAELAVLTSLAGGLFCNPNAQEHRQSGADVPLPWLLSRAG